MKRALPWTLPEDLIAEILLRLPVKSLIRFKCVCKSWLYLISDPQFAKSHFDLMLVPPTHRVLMRSLDDDSKVNSIDVVAPLSKFSAQAEFNIPPPQHGCLVGIVGSCRGFILLTNYAYIDQVFHFVVWNPSTGLYKQINYVERSMQHTFLYGIGYDSSTDDYAVVAVKLPRIPTSGGLGAEVRCFSFRTNSWCCTKGTDSYYHLGSRFTNGLLLNGVLHWLVKSHDNICIIIAFDVMEKRLSEIPVPHDAAIELESEAYHLRVMGGHLCLYLMGERSEILVMKEYKVQSSWTRSFLLSTNLFYRPHLFFRICFPEDDQGELLELHTDGNEMEISGIVDSVMYRESLLSLPGPKQPTRPSLRDAGWDDLDHDS